MITSALETRSRKEHILSQAVVSLNRMHANRWITYCARRTHMARNTNATTQSNWEELLKILNTAWENTAGTITFEIPEHLIHQAQQYDYVARRLR